MKQIAVTCPVPGTYLVHPEPLPMGKTAASGVAVHIYDFGIICEICTIPSSSRKECAHILAVREQYPEAFASRRI